MNTTREILHVLNALSTTSNIRAERDVEDPADLSDQLAKLAVLLRDQGQYDRYRLLTDSADALEVMGAELAEARSAIKQALVEIKDLRDDLAMYRVVQVVPATRETPAEYAMQRVDEDVE